MRRENPKAMNPEAQGGYAWLDTPDKVLHVDERVLEFTSNTPGGEASG